jgi:hypothetical protein
LAARQGEGDQVDGIFRPHHRQPVLGNREFRVEVHVLSGEIVEELEVTEQRGVRENILQVEQFAPAVMSDDDIRHEAERPDFPGRRRRRLGAAHGDLELARMLMDALIRSPL